MPCQNFVGIFYSILANSIADEKCDTDLTLVTGKLWYLYLWCSEISQGYRLGAGPFHSPWLIPDGPFYMQIAPPSTARRDCTPHIMTEVCNIIIFFFSGGKCCLRSHISSGRAGMQSSLHARDTNLLCPTERLTQLTQFIKRHVFSLFLINGGHFKPF